MQDKTKIFSAALIIMLCFLFLPSCPAQSAITIYRRTNLLGGDPNDLDGIDGADLVEGDIAWVYINTGNYKYDYRLDATSGAAESSPEVISPDTNPESKRWILQHIVYNALGGLGDMSAQDANNVAITGGTITGITELDANNVTITGGTITQIVDLAVADGGTGASTAAAARTNLGLNGTIYGDSTAGRVMRVISVRIEDGTDPNTIAVATFSKWNGDAISQEDNLAKGGSTTSFALSAGGSTLTIKNTAITGNCIAVLSATIGYCGALAASGIYVESYQDSNDIKMLIRADDGSSIDLIDFGVSEALGIYLTYITSQ